MRGLLAISAAMAATVMAAPAHAAPVEQLSCPYDGLTPDQRKLVTAYLALIINNIPPPESGAAEASEQWIDAQVLRCAARHRWTDIERDNAKLYTGIKFFDDAFRADRQLATLNLTGLDAAIAKLPVDTKYRRLTRDEKRILMEQIARSGVHKEDKVLRDKIEALSAVAFQLRNIKAAFVAGTPARQPAPSQPTTSQQPSGQQPSGQQPSGASK